MLRAMYLNENRARGSLRFSFGRFNSDPDIERALGLVPQVVDKLRRLPTAMPESAVTPPLGV